MASVSGTCRRHYVWLGLAALACGALYYLLFRGADSTLLGKLLWPANLPAGPFLSPPSGWLESLPTFLHVIGFSAVTLAFFASGTRRDAAIPLFWTLLNILLEFGQVSSFGAGTFCWTDILAALLAGSLLMAKARLRSAPAVGHSVLRRAGLSCILAAGVLSILGSVKLVDDHDTSGPESPKPVYLSYEELRKPVRATAPLELSSAGKIYLYGDHLFVNSPNKGVHVIDNTDPANPVNQAYLPIPGNLDIAIKDGYLYADSYIDLVVIALGDLSDMRESHRVEAVFPYDPYQNLPAGVWIYGYDEKNGVVVDYQR